MVSPQGFTSLHNSHFRFEDDFDQHARRWLMLVDAQLREMHEALSICHCDVKPSNIICYPRTKAARTFSDGSQSSLANLDATLIDFEHCVSVQDNSTHSFSGTLRYASRRIFLLLKSCRARGAVEEFRYTPFDDFESLFFSAFEILHNDQRLPWRMSSTNTHTRDELFDEVVWSTYRTHFTHDSWALLSSAWNKLRRGITFHSLWYAHTVASDVVFQCLIGNDGRRA